MNKKRKTQYLDRQITIIVISVLFVCFNKDRKVIVKIFWKVERIRLTTLMGENFKFQFSHFSLFSLISNIDFHKFYDF